MLQTEKRKLELLKEQENCLKGFFKAHCRAKCAYKLGVTKNFRHCWCNMFDRFKDAWEHRNQKNACEKFQEASWK